MFQLPLLNYPILIICLFCFSCEYSDHRLEPDSVINPDINHPLIDLVRDQEMLFHVYDALDSSFIGTEKWTYQSDEVKDSILYHRFYSLRSYAYDSSGGLIRLGLAHERNDLWIFFPSHWTEFFIKNWPDKVYPGYLIETDSAWESGPNGQTMRIIRNYEGKFAIFQDQKSHLYFRAGLDSTALPTKQAPYLERREDYYFDEQNGLQFMTQSDWKIFDSQDSLFHAVFKVRQP